jgi:hypothetical protein
MERDVQVMGKSWYELLGLGLEKQRDLVPCRYENSTPAKIADCDWPCTVATHMTVEENRRRWRRGVEDKRHSI